ncbi:AAA family ATPase [uncultured Shewanella sp.]|uniref:AAA family ATPase n=1 Tax=uncultured Shewanella sp. TaxID=173975 RepID=UPI0026042358|nr:AAA family ATPase [uncultured Shewanella sp.]
MHDKQQLIVFTGGPSSGKTSIINTITSGGEKCVVEVGRQVIKSEVLKGGQALPWGNKTQFRDQMLKAELSSYQTNQHSSGKVFFDRGIIDCYGYSLLEQLAFTDELVQACKENKYHQAVFIFPPWKDIYVNDTERKQGFKEAIKTYEAMYAAYTYFGYTLIEVPFVSVEERVKFIFTSLGSMSS